jgi:hypothetical protein
MPSAETRAVLDKTHFLTLDLVREGKRGKAAAGTRPRVGYNGVCLGGHLETPDFVSIVG